MPTNLESVNTSSEFIDITSDSLPIVPVPPPGDQLDSVSVPQPSLASYDLKESATKCSQSYVRNSFMP